jgi:hypothetical protein
MSTTTNETRAPARFTEDIRAIAASVRATTKPPLDRMREAVKLALAELKFLRDRGAAGIN